MTSNLIHDLEVADSKAASRKGDSAAAAEHAKNADYTKDWANKGGCSSLASEARLAERRGVGFTPGPGTSPTRPRRSGRPEKLRAGPE